MDNPLKTATARIEVEVLDLNDNLPEFEVDFYNISIVENLPNGEFRNGILKLSHCFVFALHKEHIGRTDLFPYLLLSNFASCS